MASNRCPACANEHTRALKNISPNQAANYHRCDGCGHVWVVFTNGQPRTT